MNILMAFIVSITSGVMLTAMQVSKLDYNEMLLKAAQEGNTSLVLEALAHKADVNFQNKDKCTALHYATYAGHSEIVKILLKAKAKKELKDDSKLTPLAYAADKGHSDIVKMLLQAGARKDVTLACDYHTPLFWAALNGHTQVVKALLAKKVNNKIASDALHQPAYEGYNEIVQLLLDAKADINHKFGSCTTPIIFAIQGNQPSTVKLLIKAKAELEPDRCLAEAAANDFGSYGKWSRYNLFTILLTRGIIHKHTKNKGLLLDCIKRKLYWFKEDITSIESLTPVMWAVIFDKQKRVDKLLATDPVTILQEANSNGETPLMLAQKYSHYCLVENLYDRLRPLRELIINSTKLPTVLCELISEYMGLMLLKSKTMQNNPNS